MTEYLLIAIVIFIAGAVHGSVGFGQGLIAMPLMALFIDIKTVIPLSLFNGLVIGVTLVLRWRRRLDFSKAAPLIISSMFGIPIGVYFLKTWDASALKMGLGVLLASYSLYSLTGVKIKTAMSAGWGYVFGFFSGMVGGAFGLNGPVSLLYVMSAKWAVEEKKVVLVTYFVTSNIMILILYFASGVPMTAPATYAAICAPTAIAGAMIGAMFSDRLNKETLERVIYGLVLIMGITLMV
ncbi:MAG: sulfite exporter TauE/SafE family protein [Nitrospinae bacterium]|nr:sulfite exporter TauE/SafE family protein [Nitrospinota bacterium]